MAAAPFTHDEFLAFRRDLVRLQRLGQAAQGRDPLQAHDLRTVEALADCLSRFLTDAPLILLLTTGEAPATTPDAPMLPVYDMMTGAAVGTVAVAPGERDAVLWPTDADAPPLAAGELDPDWDSWDPRAEAAPPADTKQTNAQRSLIYGLCAAINMHPAHLRSWLHSRFGLDIDCIEALTHAQSITAIADRQAKLRRMDAAASGLEEI